MSKESREYRKFLKMQDSAVRMLVLKGMHIDDAQNKVDELIQYYNNDYNKVTEALILFIAIKNR